MSEPDSPALTTTTERNTTLSQFYDDFEAVGELLAIRFREMLGTITDGTLKDLALRLKAARSTQEALGDLIFALETTIAESMEEDAVNIDGVGRLARRQKSTSTWVHDGAREQMLDDARREISFRVARDPATGELHQPLVQACRESIRLFEECFSISADPKVALRKTLGLDPSLYRSKSASGFSVKIEEDGL